MTNTQTKRTTRPTNNQRPASDQPTTMVTRQRANFSVADSRDRKSDADDARRRHRGARRMSQPTNAKHTERTHTLALKPNNQKGEPKACKSEGSLGWPSFGEKPKKEFINRSP